MRLKEALRGKLTEKELSLLRGFDTVGDIAVLEIPRELEKKKKIIAKTLLALLPYLKVAVKKKGGHKGRFRKQPLEILAGEKRKTTVHKEFGAEMALNVETCYFSPRLANERQRIAKQVKPGEVILVMFSGIAPYPLVIAKLSQAYKIYGIEANPDAHKYAVENVKRNKLGHKIILIKGDAGKKIPNVKFDRIVMPWPQKADEFLDAALKASQKGTVIHFYDFQPEGKWDEAKKITLAACKKAKKKCKILKVVECGQVGVRQNRVCVDFVVG
ncbi:MAG: class I SAM-dependent methyltransferase family protein [Candidatus Woesearchaeota archaeon]